MGYFLFHSIPSHQAITSRMLLILKCYRVECNFWLRYHTFKNRVSGLFVQSLHVYCWTNLIFKYRIKANQVQQISLPVTHIASYHVFNQSNLKNKDSKWLPLSQINLRQTSTVSCKTRQLCWKSLKWTRTDSCATFFFTLKAKKYSKKFVQKTLKNDCYCLVFSILKVWIRIYWLYHSKVYQILLKKTKQKLHEMLLNM